MENHEIRPATETTTEESKAKQESSRVGLNFWKAFGLFCVFCIASFIIFIWQQWNSFSFSYRINNELFGTFGDFIGGILGTIVAFYSVYLLVRTFQNQIETNANVIKTNESSIATNKNTIESNKKLIEQTHLQIFDSRFKTLLDLYHKAMDAYSHKISADHHIHGRDAFEKVALDFRDKGYENHTEYKRRSIGAVSEYRVLYAIQRREISVHFRMLYLLFKLIAEEKMKEVYRVSYIKGIRGQLSEGELLLLRYNGYTTYGQKMCQYINQFNLLKHLPVMSLLEFSYWRKMVSDDAKISSIDQVYLVLKQEITQMLDIEGNNEKNVTFSSRYIFNLYVNDNHDCISIALTKFTRKKKGGAVKRPPIEPAFDAIRDNEFRAFLIDFFTEMFVYSNFFQFNGNDHTIVSVKVDNKDVTKVKFNIKIERPGKPLSLAQRQVVPVEL